MKIKLNRSIWRTQEGRLWRLADRICATAEAVRGANKPYDLVFPITNIIWLSIQLREAMWEWVEHALKHDTRNRGRWPHL